MGVGGLSQEMHKAWAHWGKLGHIHSQYSVTPSPGKGGTSFLGTGGNGPLLVSTGLSGRHWHFERTPGLVNLQFHTELGSGCGSVTGNSSPTSPTLGWPRQEGEEGTLAGSHKAQETESIPGSRQLPREGLSTSNQ